MADQEIAALFHEAYERLAPSFGYETRAETRQFDPQSANGRLMAAVCGEVRAALASPAPQLSSLSLEGERKDAQRYRLLRRGQQWSVINWIGNTLRAEDLDAAIDAAMKPQS